MVLDVFSDYLCPWCFLGARRLHRILATVDSAVAVHFRAFQLRPRVPAEGLDRRAMLAQRYGAQADPTRVPARLAEVAAEEGLSFHYGAMTRVPNTLAAHRLMAALQGAGASQQVCWSFADTLFRGYFQEGRDLGDTAWLLPLAQRAGVHEPRAALRDDSAAAQAVARDFEEAQAKDVVGVPNLYFAGRFSLPGVQGEETLRYFLQRALERLS